MYAVALQGGAMRSVYCLGAVRALTELGLAARAGSVHASSAGCVSAAVLVNQMTELASPSVGDVVDALLERLGDKRFIDQRRYTKVVDVDYLVEVMREVCPVSADSLEQSGARFEVALTDADLATPSYAELNKTDSNSYIDSLFRATMAIPVLYHRPVRIGGRRFVDGGIADPLPVFRALAERPEAVIAVSSVPRGGLAKLPAARDARIIQVVPGISPSVRRLMLTRNPLAKITDDAMEHGSFGGVPIRRITPSRPEMLGSRVDTDREHLLRLGDLGYADAMNVLAP